MRSLSPKAVFAGVLRQPDKHSGVVGDESDDQHPAREARTDPVSVPSCTTSCHSTRPRPRSLRLSDSVFPRNFKPFARVGGLVSILFWWRICGTILRQRRKTHPYVDPFEFGV